MLDVSPEDAGLLFVLVDGGALDQFIRLSVATFRWSKKQSVISRDDLRYRNMDRGRGGNAVLDQTGYFSAYPGPQTPRLGF